MYLILGLIVFINAIKDSSLVREPRKVRKCQCNVSKGKLDGEILG